MGVGTRHLGTRFIKKLYPCTKAHVPLSHFTVDKEHLTRLGVQRQTRVAQTTQKRAHIVLIRNGFFITHVLRVQKLMCPSTLTSEIRASEPRGLGSKFVDGLDGVRLESADEARKGPCNTCATGATGDGACNETRKGAQGEHRSWRQGRVVLGRRAVQVKQGLQA